MHINEDRIMGHCFFEHLIFLNLRHDFVFGVVVESDALFILKKQKVSIHEAKLCLNFFDV